MNKLKITSLALILLTSIGFAQDSIITATVKKEPLTRQQFLDSIKGTFVRDNLAACIDSMWMKELASLDLYDELTLDIENIDVDQKVDYELPTELLKERLKKLDEKSPFNIEYNQGLENVIKSFLKNRRKSFERLMGISQYYFPMFEESLSAQNIPLEIKYLAVVESALNPRAVSRVGATGLWQFMYQTGKQYNLNIDTYIDERSDPLKASKAATQYMKNMYAIFGDWDLVLASYNSGPGNVAKAIRRSGGKQNYWNIRPYLHKETQGYVPAFLATMYIFEYHKEHGIVPQKPVANHYATDTINIKRKMTFKQISDLLDVSVAELQFLNPSYKRDVIPYITGENHYLRLPSDKIARFVSNEDKIYAYVNYEDSLRERPFTSSSAIASNGATTSRLKYHKVKRGDTLSEISESYGVSVSELKKWNKLRSNYAPLGRKLKIYTEETVAVVEKKPTKVDTTFVKESKTAIASNTKNYIEEKVVSYKDVVKYHKVKKGDNLGEIANKYDVSVAEVKKWNKLKSNNINLGASLKIVKNERVVTIVKKEIKADKVNSTIEEETQVALNENNDAQANPEDFYVVQKGDNLFTIAKKFNVSLEDLKEWNNIEDGIIQSGSKIVLNNESKASKEVEETPKAETKIVEYVVKSGDNLGAIAKKYNASISDLKDWNELEDDNITVGSKLIVSKKLFVVPNQTVKATKNQAVAQSKKEEVKHYYVKKGDSLFSIAKKYPGVTISDIKKWNDIKNESIKPGMKLRISS
ncbi:LysM peptidoglycan-binding domain-containing protein [Flavobacterium capsici]|uniref:LysM peptidoglycan-binding domain-containing protein n=1 Tax=Flavobacterium capsici TaxID=3075618 RepID=A0AA96J8Q6_9FLAO|nr:MULTISPECIES: LysM peptidoglycan-binding domain-containing protein [unclassified Flavobacterium]WNM19634.1 LysM peptidoglycan-binding domain-containing protein [Flavobacterium sp. PMR2A8]WNM21023.1 LysM peptidoglycan-binding domain-containing protein [Flavobacterium sp. PMTSA4]